MRGQRFGTVTVTGGVQLQQWETLREAWVPVVVARFDTRRAAGRFARTIAATK